MLHPSLLHCLTDDTLRGLHDICTGNASAWASAELHEIYSLMNPYGAGWHLDRAHFDEMMRGACDTMLLKGKFVAVRRTDVDATTGSHWFGWELDVRLAESDAEEIFRAKWLVDATGRKASVAHKVSKSKSNAVQDRTHLGYQIGAKTRKHSDLLSFYVVFEGVDVDTDLSDGDDDTRTLIEAAANGWWYSARLPHRKRLVMYTTSPSNPTVRVARSATGFLDLLHSDTVHISRSLCGTPHQDTLSADASATAPVPIYEVPPGTKFTRCTTAASSILEPYASWEPQSEFEAGEDHQGRGWCAVGDAALAFDPLSSQGIITALNAGIFLGSVLARYLRPSPADGDPRLGGGDAVDEIQRAYERVRERYEEGRAYYYRIVKRFEVAGEETEENGRGFWERQR